MKSFLCEKIRYKLNKIDKSQTGLDTELETPSDIIPRKDTRKEIN